MSKKGVTNTNNIGANIRTARMRADLTQEAMAEMIEVTPQHLSGLERGLVGTSIPTLMRICTELNVSADFILFGSSSDIYTTNSTLIEKIQRLPKHKADIVERYIDFVFEIMDMDPNQRTNK